MEQWWNDNDVGKNRSTLTETCPISTLPATNALWTAAGLRLCLMSKQI